MAKKKVKVEVNRKTGKGECIPYLRVETIPSSGKIFASLCYRCEHRAKFLDDGTQPRYECGLKERAVYNCYMYKPVQPIVLKAAEGEDRPLFGPWMFSGRVNGARVCTDMQLVIDRVSGGMVAYWIPVSKNSKKNFKEGKNIEGDKK